MWRSVLRLSFEVAALARLVRRCHLGNCNASTAAQQSAAPDRLQLRSLRSFLTSLSALPVAGELSVVLRASVSRKFDVGFVGRCCLPARGGSTRVGVVVARTWRRWLFRSSVPEPNNTQHNQALHPTARSVVVFAAFSLDSWLVVTGGRRVSLALCRARQLDAASGVLRSLIFGCVRCGAVVGVFGR